MGRCSEICQACLSTSGQDLDSFLHVSKVERVLELAAGVLPDLGDLHHLLQFLQIPRDQVEEGEFVKVLGSLVAHFHHLVIALKESGFSQFLPTILVIKTLGSL